MIRALVVTAAIASTADARPNKRVIEPVTIDAATAAAIPADGIYFIGATSSGSTGPEDFYIARLDRKGITELFHEPGDDGPPRGDIGVGFIDGTHAVSYEPVNRAERVTVFTLAGAAKPTLDEIVVPDSAWTLRKDEKLAEYTDQALLITSTGEVWISRKLDGSKQRRYLRVFGGSRMQVAKRPDHVLTARIAALSTPESEWHEAFPKVAAPRGLHVAITRGTGIGGKSGTVTCSGQGQRDVVPPTQDDGASSDLYTYGYFPTKFRWLLANPPVYVILGTAASPVDEPFELIEFRRACSAPRLGKLRYVRPRLWAEEVEGTGGDWTQLRVDDVPIGRVAGGIWNTMFSP